MKAILVIDMPEDCYGCPCYQGMSGDSFCGVSNEDTMINTDTKPNHCPLKPFPKFYPSTSNPQRIECLKQLGMTEKEQHYYELGHDDCIDEILGEENAQDNS